MCYGSMHALTNQIIKSIQSDGTDDPTVQGNWPNDAVCAVRYCTRNKLHSSAFPAERHTVYFTTMEDSVGWFAQRRALIKANDSRDEVSCELFNWDLGPEFIGTLTY